MATLMCIIVNAKASPYGHAKRDPEWNGETGPAGYQIRNARGQVMRRVDGKWKTVKP